MSEQPKEEIGWGPEGSQALDVLSSEFEIPSSYQPGNSPIPEFSSFLEASLHGHDLLNHRSVVIKSYLAPLPSLQVRW